MSDELWPHFVPLWTDLRKVSSSVLLAGGYGLFLKQKLVSRREVPTIIAIDRWIDQNPRVTNDFDLVVEVNLIASPEKQAELNAILEKHNFKAVPGNERWQFAKTLGGDRVVSLDFHAPAPTEKRSDLRVDTRRVRPNPSLHVGIHGRKNPEAIGCELAPFNFSLDGCEIIVPNPVTWAVMKLVAMRDQWTKAQDPNNDAKRKAFYTAQASKHAQDVFRVVAMMTSEERDQIQLVLTKVRSSPAFLEARTILRQFFGEGGAFGLAAVQRFWQADDARLIREILSEWFQ